MASYIRLIDGTIGIGEIEQYDEEFINILNFVEFDTWPSETIEQRYTFRGMCYPFSPLDPIRVTIPSINVLSVNDDVDNHLLVQYNNYVRQWFTAREEMTKPRKRKPKIDETEDYGSMIETLGEILKESSNTTIH